MFIRRLSVMISKIIALIIAGALSMSYVTETGEDLNGRPINPEKETNMPVNRGITVNKIPFTNITDTSKLPSEVQTKIEEVKGTQGFYLFPNKDYGLDEYGYHVLISLGEKNTGGYSIKVTAVEDNEGKTIIYVEEGKPTEGSMTIQAITYPYSLIKIKGVTPYVKIVSKDGHIYADLNNSK
jgi:hypothetical protein